jgi:hypothetical protein
MTASHAALIGDIEDHAARLAVHRIDIVPQQAAGRAGKPYFGRL